MLSSYLEKLITFKTLPTDHEENSRAFEWILDELKGLPLFIKEHASEGFPSLTITTQDTKTPRIWLVGHMDIVAGSENLFKPRYEGTKLYGRGVFDMKFAIASYIHLLLELKESLQHYDFGVMLTSDEEIGGKNGAGYLTKQGYLSKLSIIPDGGENWKFQEWAKGVLHLRVESRGKTAHGSRPWEGKSATEGLISYLHVLQSEFITEPCTVQDHAHDTLNIGKIQGGISTNQIPDYAEAILDIRFIPSTTKEELWKRLRKHLSSHPTITLHELTHGVSYKVDKKNMYFKTFINIARKKISKPTEYIFSHGSSDARYFIEKDTPALLIRPIGGNIHSEDEWIDIEDLSRFYEVLKEFITTKAKVNHK